MLRRTALVASILALLVMLVVGTAAAQDAAKGKTLWEQKNCKSCHGTNGEGKYAGARAGDTRTAAQWVTQVRTPRSMMPSFSAAQVSDQDLADMLAYMKTLQAPATVTIITYTPQANDLPGKVLFNQKRCVACHGADPTNFLRTRFTNQNRTLAAADVIKQLRTPAQNMPSFSATQVSDAEATQIAAYFTSLLAAAPAAATPGTTPAAATTPAAGATPRATGTTLPASGEQLPLALIVVIGSSLVGLGIGLRLLWRHPA